VFFGPAWFCIKPRSMVLHFFNSAKQLSNVLLTLRTISCIAAAHRIQNPNLPGIEHATDHGHRFQWSTDTEKMPFLYLNNFYSQKVKPCGRTTRFSSAGLHCQAQKGRQTVLDGGRRWGRGI